MKKTTSAPLLLLLLLILFTKTTHAQILEGDRYMLDLDGSSSINKASKDSTISQDRTITGPGFMASLSYDDESKPLPLVMTISTNILNFGKLTPGEAVMRSISVKVLQNTTESYQILSAQNKNLSTDKSEIPATSCDSGNCTQILSDSWVSPLVYGLGFRCDDHEGSLCMPKMAKNNFKKLASYSLDEQPVRILQGFGNKSSSSILTYKVNIPGNQPQGGYQNIIEYIISPNL